MTLLYGEPTRLDDLLTSIVTQVVKATALPADKVLLTLLPDSDHASVPCGDRFALVRPTIFPVTFGVSGGGRATTGFDGNLDINLLVRYTADQELRQVKVLTGRTLGVVDLSQRLINGMQLFEPVNAGVVKVLREPMRIRTLSFDSLGIKAKSPWVVVRTTWEMKFNVPLS